MELRVDLTPRKLRLSLIKKLAYLADQIDGGGPGCEEKISEFNFLAGTNFDYYAFQGIYGGMGHEAWVRATLVDQNLRPANPKATRDELIEIVKRARSFFEEKKFVQYDDYCAIFDINVRMAGASRKLFGKDDPGAIVDQALATDDVIYL